MTYYAEIKKNKVMQVIVSSNDDIKNHTGNWIKLKSDDIAGIGYDYVNGEFKSKQPFPSWTWKDKRWNSPIPYPKGLLHQQWNEEIKQWVGMCVKEKCSLYREHHQLNTDGFFND
jgi:hypothetical protein|tara:strand:+ start:1192 stop:1536 length:345 start_codon:yes stop_codon:yes gene_type:complete